MTVCFFKTRKSYNPARREQKTLEKWAKGLQRPGKIAKAALPTGPRGACHTGDKRGRRPGSVVRSLVRRDWGMGQGAKRGHRLYLVRPPGDLRSSHWNSEWGALRLGQAEALLPKVTLLAQPRACRVRIQPGHRWPRAPGDHHIPSSLCTQPSAHPPELE